MDAPTSTLWPMLHYADTNRALAHLVEVFGVSELVSARDETRRIVHAEVGWPGGGRPAFGASCHDEGVHASVQPGTAALYAVVDDVDGLHQRVKSAGGDIVAPPADAVFGSGAVSRVFTSRDPEGNLWTFGSYGAHPG
jgi:uncharacterized glyoxalase superfamily protein PhnB